MNVGAAWGPFLPLQTSNSVTLDFVSSAETITMQHYAFLMSEEEFDGAFERIKAAGVTYYPGPDLEPTRRDQPQRWRARPVLLGPGRARHEIITRPHWSSGWN